MALKVRITSADGQVKEVVLDPGATLTILQGDKVEVVDSAGRPFEIAAEGDDVVLTLMGTSEQVVIIDGVRYGGAPQETYTFENLALYVEDRGIDSSIVYTDPDAGQGEAVVVASIEDLLTGIGTAAAGGAPQGTFGASPEPVQLEFSQDDPLAVPPQESPAGFAVSLIESGPEGEVAGGGADTFVIRGQDAVETFTDIIADFEPDDDVLDLTDVFADAGVGNPALDDHFAFVEGDFDGDGDADDTAVVVDTSGSGGFGGDPVVVLFNVSATDLSVGDNVLVAQVI